MRVLLATLLVTFALSGSAAAGLVEDENDARNAISAWVRKEYGDVYPVIRRLAEQGYAWAQGNLGALYNNGLGVPNDDAEAEKWFRRAAALGEPGAQTSLAQWYVWGYRVSRNYGVAINWYRAAADQGYSLAQFQIGWMYMEGRGVPRDYAQAALWFRRSAEQGEPGAQAALAMLFLEGRGVPQDYSEAVKWFRLVAAQGREGAVTKLGELYQNGQGVPQNSLVAAAWYRRAADLGDPIAQGMLAFLYYKGNGVPQDFVQARKWCTLAARDGPSGEFRSNVLKLRNLVAAGMEQVRLSEAERQASEWRPKRFDPAIAFYSSPVPSPWNPPSTIEPEINAVSVQGVLRLLGYNLDPTKDLTGPAMRAAIMKFEGHRGVRETGEIAPKLIDQMTEALERPYYARNDPY